VDSAGNFHAFIFRRWLNEIKLIRTREESVAIGPE
jgi:hypothetical protein